MTLDKIRTIWGMIGAFIVALNVSWIPDIVKGIFSAEASELLFTAIGALIALYQLTKKRTGEGQPQALHKVGDKKIVYMLNPFASAA